MSHVTLVYTSGIFDEFCPMFLLAVLERASFDKAKDDLKVA